MRVVVTDDSVLLREGLVRLLTEVGSDVVASADDAPSLVAAVDEHQPDVAVIDIRMPPTMTDDGLRAAVQLRSVTNAARGSGVRASHGVRRQRRAAGGSPCR